MIHQYEVFYLHDDALARAAGVCFLDVFRYANGDQMGIVVKSNFKGGVPVYMPASLVELVAYAPSAPGYLARVQLTLTDGRVYILDVLRQGGTAIAAAFERLCSCSSGPIGTDNTQFLYLRGIPTVNTVGGPATLTTTLPAQAVDGVWNVVASVNWSVSIQGGSPGFLPQNRGDAFFVQCPNITDGTGPWTTVSADNSIGETINANVTDIDGQIMLQALIHAQAGIAVDFNVVYARSNYIDTAANPLGLQLACNANLTLAAGGQKIWAYAFFVPTSNPIIIL
jgi:hypothetical protein